MPELGWAIFAVIFINAIFSFWQEFRAEKATEALKQMIPRNAKVIRDGKTIQIPAAELVPGDLIVLEEGDAISADARLIEEYELRTNNATLTGESEPVRKSASPHTDPNLTQIEMPNLVFAGTSVAYGGGRAVVFATGHGHAVRQDRRAHPERRVRAQPAAEGDEQGRPTRRDTWRRVSASPSSSSATTLQA